MGGLLYGGGVDRNNQNKLNGLDGQDIAKSQLTPAFWQGLDFNAENGWTLPAGETGVPILTNTGAAAQTSTLPIHLNASVTIASQPTKFSYNNGDLLDLSGLTVNVVLRDGTTATGLAYNYADFNNKGLFVANPGTTVSASGNDGKGLRVSISGTNIFTTTSALTVAKTQVLESDITFPTATGITYDNSLYDATLSDSNARIGSTTIGNYAWNYASPWNMKPTVSNSGYQVKLVPDYYEGGNYDFTGLLGWDSATNTVVRTISVAVSPKAITATITPQSKTYDGTADATIGSTTYVGKVETDDVSITGGALAFNNKEAGTNKTVTAGAVFTLTGAAAGNYTINGTPTVNKASIVSKAITVTPNDNQSKFVGDSDLALTYSFSGQVGGEVPNFTGTLTRIAGASVGNYAIQQGTLALIDNSEFSASNYNLAFTSGKNFTISAVPVAPTVTTTSLPGAIAGVPYSQMLAATGDAPITWSISSGSLPTGLSLSAGSGSIYGTPTTAGAFDFTVKATNATDNYTKALSITVNTPTYAVSATTNAVQSNGVTATAAFGATPYAASAAATVTIALSGTATATGTHTVGLTSTKAGTITPPVIVTKAVTAGAAPADTFAYTFTMPAHAVDDLVVTHTFLQAQSTAPAVSAVTVAKTAATQEKVDFTLGSALTGTWKVYDAQTGGNIVSDITASASGTTLSLTHASNMPAGTYYVAVTEAGKAESVRLSLTVGEYVTTYTMTASALTVFASQTAGYATAPAAQTVTISNTGNQVITLTQPAITNASGHFNIGVLSSTTLVVGSTATFTVQPKTGLAVGTYTEAINIAGSNSAVTSVSAQFNVAAANNAGSTPSTATPLKDEKVDVIFDKDAQKAATAKVEEKDNVKTTTVTLNEAAVKENLDKMDKANPDRKDKKVIIPVINNSDVVVGELNGQMVKYMEDKQAVIEIKTEDAYYTLPAVDINIDDILSQMGKQVELKDIKVSVRIAKASSATAAIVEDSAKRTAIQLSLSLLNLK